jgi:YVTN family beta-propeller protein
LYETTGIEFVAGVFMKPQVWKLLGLILTVIFAMSATSTVQALGVIATVTVGNLPGGVAYDSAKGEIFVANSNSGTVSIISDSTFTPVPTPVPTPTPTPTPVPTPVSSTVPTPVPPPVPTPFTQVPSSAVVANVHVGNYPFGVAYDSGKGEIFVTNIYDDTVSVISDSSNDVIATVPVGVDPQGLAYDSGKSEVFVANLASNQATSGVVSVISDSNNTVVATVPVGYAPNGVTYDSGKSEIFVTNTFYNMAGYISNTVKVISDSYPLGAPSVSSSPGTIDQGQTSNLSSDVTTGASPYTYQWFSEAPGTSTYSLISNATSSNYNFTTSTSTAMGNWTFMLQVTDGTGATTNSTATTMTVNAPSPSSTVPEFSNSAPILLSFIVGASLMVYFKKRKAKSV